MEKLRSSVRPILTFAFAGVILGLTCYLVLKFGEVNLTRDFAVFTLGTGAAIIGVWTGSGLKQ